MRAGNSSDPTDVPKNMIATQPKTGKSKKDKRRYVRFTIVDGATVEGTVSEKPGFSKISGMDLRFNQCYFVGEIGKVGRLWVNREIKNDDDLSADLQQFEQIAEVEDDSRIPAAPVVSVENLRKWYPLKRGFFETVFSKEEMNVKAVDDVSFNLSKGEIFALAGESGSGKTTLGKVVLRLVTPSSGRIFFLGQDITKLSDKG